MITDSIQTYRNEFTITELNGLYTVFLAGMALFVSSRVDVCKMMIDQDYPVKAGGDEL